MIVMILNWSVYPYSKFSTLTETTLDPIWTLPVGYGHKVPPALQANRHFGNGMYSPFVSAVIFHDFIGHIENEISDGSWLYYTVL